MATKSQIGLGAQKKIVPYPMKKRLNETYSSRYLNILESKKKQLPGKYQKKRSFPPYFLEFVGLFCGVWAQSNLPSSPAFSQGLILKQR